MGCQRFEQNFESTFNICFQSRWVSGAASSIKKIEIASAAQLDESWFKAEIFNGLGEVEVSWADISANDGENGIVAVELETPSGVVRID